MINSDPFEFLLIILTFQKKHLIQLLNFITLNLNLSPNKNIRCPII